MDDGGPSSASIQLFAAYKTWLKKRMGAAQGGDGDGAEDPEALKAKLDSVQQRALARYPYRCIQQFRFAEPRMARHPLYTSLVLDLLLAHPGHHGDDGSHRHHHHRRPALLDFGCCMGTDLRQLMVDGADPEDLIGVDVQDAFIDLGLDVLFEDRHALPPSLFVVTDLLASPPSSSSPGEAHEEEAGQEQKQAALKRRVEQLDGGWGLSVVYSGSVLHLFDEAGTRRVATAIHRLLSLGAGRTAGTKGEAPVVREANRSGGGEQPSLKFLHTPKSLEAMLQGCGFHDVKVWVGDGEVAAVGREEEENTDRAFFDFVAYHTSQ